jgi:PAS domain S-box-containing protein
MQISGILITITGLFLCVLLILIIRKTGVNRRIKECRIFVTAGIILLAAGLVIGFTEVSSAGETGIIIQITGLFILIPAVGVLILPILHQDRKNSGDQNHIEELKIQLAEKTNEIEMVKALLANEMEVRSSFEADILESEQKFRSMAENTPLGMVLIDRTNTIQYMNPQVTRTLGYSSEEKDELQNVIKNIFPGSDKWEEIRAKDRDVHGEAVQPSPESAPAEYPLIARDGTERVVELYFAPYGDILLLLLNDITRRKEAEQALHESDRRFREMMEQIPLNAIILDKNGDLIFANDYFLKHTGWKPEEILNENFFDRFTLPEDNAFTAYLEAINNNSITHYSEGTILTRIGERRSVLWTNLEILDNHKKFSGMVSLGADITGRKAREQAIQLANKKLNILSSITRHDIANMLSAVYLNLELMQEIIPDPSIQTMIAQCLEASKTIQDQIEFTRYYQDIGVQAPEWYNLQEIIETAIQNRPLSLITVTILTGRISIYADSLIQMVFSNLIDNAIRHGEKVSDITFTTETNGPDLNIRYADNGVGVPPEEKEKIFERGFGKHTGMGLFLIREILTITGIQIKETGTWGEGAVFILTVPAGSWKRSPDDQSS